MRFTRPITYAAVAGALAVPLLATTSASATTEPVSSAYAISASGMVTFPPTPSVTSTAKPHTKTWKSFPSNPVVKTFLVGKVSAPAGNHSMAVVSALDVLTPKASLPAGAPKLPGDLVFAEVAAARCDNGKATTYLSKVQIADKKLKVKAAPNTTVTVSLLNVGKVTATLNKQVHNADGTLTVTAIELKITLGGKMETVDISSATCGRTATGGPSSTPTPTPTPASGGEAPVPTPVNSDLPVTG